MKAVILALVSSKEQEDGHSLSAQIANLKLYAERRSLNVIKEFTIIESPTKGERPEFARMIEFVKKQKERIALIVDTVDRLQRSFRETPILNDLMEQYCLELHFVKEGNILSKDANSTQKLMWNMGITKDIYNNKLTQLVNRQQEINQLLEQHHKGNEQFKIALSSLITLTSHAYDIFESSTIDEKRQLMGYTFSNFKLKGRKLEYDLKQPLNLFADLSSHQKWLPMLDKFRTHIDEIHRTIQQSRYCFER